MALAAIPLLPVRARASLAAGVKHHAGVAADAAVLVVVILGVLAAVRDTLPAVPDLSSWAVALLGM